MYLVFTLVDEVCSLCTTTKVSSKGSSNFVAHGELHTKYWLELRLITRFIKTHRNTTLATVIAYSERYKMR